MKFVTFNIRYSWDADGINSFPLRAGMILCKIDSEKPDVICFQEASDKISDFLKAHLPEYNFTGHGRDADYTGEAMLTAVRKDTFEVLSTKTFWLSPTPELPGSRYPTQNVCRRICNVTVVKEKSSGKAIRVYNTHFDYEVEPTVRMQEAEQISATISEDNEKLSMPFVLAGDFNSAPDSEIVKHIENNTTPKLKDVANIFTQTFHDFGKHEDVSKDFKKIDYIFVPPTVKSGKPILWDDTFNGVWLSDHYPIEAELKF